METAPTGCWKYKGKKAKCLAAGCGCQGRACKKCLSKTVKTSPAQTKIPTQGNKVPKTTTNPPNGRGNVCWKGKKNAAKCRAAGCQCQGRKCKKCIQKTDKTTPPQTKIPTKKPTNDSGVMCWKYKGKKNAAKCRAAGCQCQGRSCKKCLPKTVES